MNQEEFYEAVEADQFFDRNFSAFSASHVLLEGSMRPHKVSLMKVLEENLELSGLSVLEIGCSVGDLLFVLREKYSCEVFGVEPSQKAAKIAVEQLNLDVEAVAYSNSRYFHPNSANQNKLDLIILDDVVGWMDPKNILQVASSIDWLLKPGGIVLLRELSSFFPFKVANHHHPSVPIYNHRYAGGFGAFFEMSGNYERVFDWMREEPSLQKARSSRSLSRWRDTLLKKIPNAFPVVPLEV